jgi:hypothetical protein
MDWGQWKEEYLPRLKDDRGGFELRFLEKVLMRIQSLDPSDVESQTHFVDLSGTDRYIDFTIQEGEDVRLALEVNGWDKTGRGSGMTKREFQTSSFRELSMKAQGWTLLPFANTLLKNSPATCRELLEKTLMIERERAALIQTGSKFGKQLESERNALKRAARQAVAGQRAAEERYRKLLQSQRTADVELLPEADRERFVALQAEFDRISKQLEEQTERREETEKENRGMKILGVAVVLLVVALVVIALGRDGGDGSRSLTQVRCEEAIDASELSESDYGEIVTVRGDVVQAEPYGNESPRDTYLNIGQRVPYQDLGILIEGEKRDSWGKDNPSELYKNETIVVKGRVEQTTVFADGEERSSYRIRVDNKSDIGEC